MRDRSKETYLGDGLYASFDGWHIVLRAPRYGGDHWVGLEPDVFRNLITFAESTANVATKITKTKENANDERE